MCTRDTDDKVVFISNIHYDVCEIKSTIGYKIHEN